MPTQNAPSLSVQKRLVAELVPDAKNARLHPDKHIKQLARSIENFGFNCPLLVDRNDHVVAGHGRLLAVKQLGWTEVPVIRLEHLTPSQVRAFAIAENRLNELSEWDERLLAEQLKALSDADLTFDLDAIGFELPEIDLRIRSLDISDEESTEENFSFDPAIPTVSQLGDLWQLGPHRILCGNALEAQSYATLLGDQRVAMSFVDMPYNVKISGHVCGNGKVQHAEFAMARGEMSREAFTHFLNQALGRLKQSVVAGGLIYSCIDWRHVAEMSAAGDRNALETKNICIWDKGCGGLGSLYRSQYEMVFVFKSGTAPHTNNIQLGRFGRNRSNIWSYPGVNSFARETSEGNLLALHPTAKPVALVADALLDASHRGESVIDSFLGSGTTLIAAEKTGRVAYGIELEPRYVDVAIRRWQRLTGKEAVHAELGLTFEILAQQRFSAEPPTTTAPSLIGDRP